MKRIDKKATFGQQASKVTQLADALSQAISRKEFLEGDSLPSINQLSAQYGVSRDTVFKLSLIHIYIYTDKKRLMQVITNFINNALKFTNKGQILLEYHLKEDTCEIEF